MTGFRGRMGLYELLTVSEAARDVDPAGLRRGQAARRRPLQDGMRPLRLAGALQVAEGVTTLDEVLRATPPLGVSAAARPRSV